jgi:hypothetical protein
MCGILGHTIFEHIAGVILVAQQECRLCNCVEMSVTAKLGNAGVRTVSQGESLFKKRCVLEHGPGGVGGVQLPAGLCIVGIPHHRQQFRVP